MACRGHGSAGEGGPSTTSPEGGKRRVPSRSFWLGMGAVAILAVALASAGALAAARQPEPRPEPPSSPILKEAPIVSPQDPAGPAVIGAVGSPQAPSEMLAPIAANPAPAPAEPAPAGPMPTEPVPSDPASPNAVPAEPALTPTPAPALTSSAPAPDPIASSSAAPPQAAPQAPAPAPQPLAQQLAQEAAQRFGIRIILDGQEWGEEEVAQAVNIGAVISAMERLPQTVASVVAAHPHGPLTFLSNHEGRTLAGWQPYGGFPMGFYTNSDRGPAGSVPANQVVLIPGFAPMSIGHEILHAYQFRDVGPDQYVLALLDDEMRSFMAATGWRQVGTDEEVRQAANQPWDVVNGLYVYEGRPLTYVTASGSTVTLRPPNPIEAFAVAGSIYYTRPAGMPLPDWPEYWAWLQANLE